MVDRGDGLLWVALDASCLFQAPRARNLTWINNTVGPREFYAVSLTSVLVLHKIFLLLLSIRWCR